MALPWPHNTPTLSPVPAVPQVGPSSTSATGSTTSTAAALAARVTTAARTNPALVRLVALATSPVTALVVMFLGLALLFVLPMVGLPFVALVVLPTVVYHLRAERRTQLRRPRL